MFKSILRRYQDMKTLSKLITGAEKQANANGIEKPAAEHFLLSAFSLEDGSATRIMQRMGITFEELKKTIEQVNTTPAILAKYANKNSVIQQSHGIHYSQPSGQDFVKLLYTLKQQDKQRPLLSAHALQVANQSKQGVITKAFDLLEIDRAILDNLIQDELNSI